VCASTLAKVPEETITAYDKLMTSIVRALANCAAKCKDVATFNRVLRALLLVSHAVMIPVCTNARSTLSIASSLCCNPNAISCVSFNGISLDNTTSISTIYFEPQRYALVQSTVISG
jgi:hypothetical protein